MLFRNDREESEILWVIFSARNVPPGKFSMSNLFSEIKGSKLYFNCLNNSWYQNDIDVINAKISEIRNNGNYRRIIFIGSSMGAYAAVLFGVLNKADSIIALAPNLMLSRRFTYSHYYVSEPNPFYDDLFELVKHNTGNKPIIFLGTEDAADSLYADIYYSNYREYFELHYVKAGHDVSSPMNKAGVLKDIFELAGKGEKIKTPRFLKTNWLERKLARKQYALLNKFYDGNTSGKELGWKLLKLVNGNHGQFYTTLVAQAVYDKDEYKTEKFCLAGLKYKPESVYLLYTLAKLYYRQKHYTKSHSLLKSLLAKEPGSEKALKLLAQCNAKTGKKLYAYKAYNKLHRLHPDNPAYLAKSASYAYEANILPHAEELCTKLLVLNMHDHAAEFLMAKIKNKLGKKHEALKHTESAVFMAPDNIKYAKLLAELKAYAKTIPA